MASKKRRKLSFAGYVIIGLLFIVTVILLVMLMKYFFLDRNKTVIKDKHDKDVITDKKEDETDDPIDYGIYLNEYRYYVVKDADFDFIIADFDFNNESVVYDLDNFVTSENIRLSENDKYIKELNKFGIYPAIANVISKIPDKTKAFSGKILIPVLDKNSKELKLNYNEQEFILKLNDKSGDINTLMYHKESEVTDNDTFRFTITGVENLTGIHLERNGEQYEISSSKQLYGLICDVEVLDKNAFVIENAYFEDSYGYHYDALSSDIKAFDVDNLVGLRVLKGSTGAILFAILEGEQDQNTLTYGKLHIKLVNDASEYIINVSLN